MHPARDSLSTADHQAWRDFLRRYCGLDFPEGRVRHLDKHLDARMRRRGIASHAEYYRLATSDPAGGDELADLLELLTNNHSRFFRHAPAFEALANELLPRLIDRGLGQVGEICLWSAGCASGQEAYSLAIAFLEARGTGGLRARITGSDLNRRVLRSAERGRYLAHEVGPMPQIYREKYLAVEGSEGDRCYRVAERVRAMTRFRHLNLLDEVGYWVGPQDVIFCQNVLIYFGASERAEVVGHLCRRLNPGGFLLLGPTDLVDLELPGMSEMGLERVKIYQRDF